MQKWRYLTIAFRINKTWVGTVDGKEMPMNEALNYVGNFGWELVTITSTTNMSNVMWAYFKQPAP